MGSNKSKSGNLIKMNRLEKHMLAYKYDNEDWGTVAFSIPRSEIQGQFIDKELRYNCIYFLYGTDCACNEKIYVGQAGKRNNGESVLARLREHDKSATDSYRDKWQYIIAVTNRNDTWTLDDLNALENAFYHKIPTEKMLNGNTPNSGGADFNLYDDKIKQIKEYVHETGCPIFDEDEEIQNSETTVQAIDDSNYVEDIQSGMSNIPEFNTPSKVVKEMIDMLPADVWNSKTKFLDPACKKGEYLREIYDRLMNTEVIKSEFPNQFERSNHILQNQIYGISLSSASKERATQKLLSFGMNIKIIPHYIEILKNKNNYLNSLGTSIKEVIGSLFGDRNMKFDVVIGNPPYQEINGGGRTGSGAKSLYDKFIELGLNLGAPYVCMIVKNNWLTYQDFDVIRARMLAAGLSRVVNFPRMHEVFSGVSVTVNKFLINRKDTSGKIHYTVVDNGKAVSNFFIDRSKITDKIPENPVEAKLIYLDVIENSFGKHVLSAYPFGIKSNGVNMRGQEVELSDFDFGAYNIPIAFLNEHKKMVAKFISVDDISRNQELVNKYKIICGLHLAKNSSVITNIHGLMPGNICAGSFGVLFTSNNQNEAIAAMKYIKTRFVRMLVYMAIDIKSTVASYRFRFVPDQDFTSSSDIDWSKSIADIDQQLYQKYNLSDEEIEYIEKTIKPMA